jgi:hypothetical protein
MDFLAQQFMAITKKLREGLKELRDLFQKQTEAIEEATRAYREAAPPTPVLSAQLQVPDTLVNKVIADIRPNEKREKFKVAVETLTFLMVLVYAIITGFTWYAFIRSLSINPQPLTEPMQLRLRPYKLPDSNSSLPNWSVGL